MIRNFAAHDSLNAIGGRSQNSVLDTINALELSGVKALSIETLLEDNQIDGVAIATPSDTHFILAQRALRAKKHVFLEKPMTLSLTEARALHILSEEEDRMLMVGHILQYHPAFIRLCDWVASGRLGDLRSIRAERISRGRVRKTESVLWSFAPHDVSMILSLTGSLPNQVRAIERNLTSGSHADEAHIMLDFDQHIRADIFVSWLGPHKSQRISVTGTRGIACFDDLLEWPKKLCFQAYHFRSDDNNVLSETEWAVLDPVEPLFVETRAFLDSIRNQKKAPSDGSEGVRVATVLAAAEAAAKQD